MESFAFSITVMAAAILLIVIIQLVRQRLADMEESGEIRSEAAAPEAPKPADSDDTPVYDSIDCFDDCMRAFKWRPKEEVECARACGLNRM